MEKVRWGVLGTAGIARDQTIPGMQLAENCILYAVAGRNPEKAEAFRRDFGFEKSYGNYDALLADPGVEAVYIPLSNDLHCEWTIRALRAGKHVLCEKPLAVSRDQAQSMFRAAAENGVYLMEAFAYLHSPIVRAIRSEIDAGMIGEIRYLESAFITSCRPDTDFRLKKECGGGAMYDLGCYALSMALWMIGRAPENVKAIARFSDRKIDLFTSALLLYDDGTVANLDCGMLSDLNRLDRLHISGTRGEIVSPMAFNQMGEIPYTLIRDGKAETKVVSCPNNYRLEVEQLGRCVRGEAVPHVSGEFSLLTAGMTDRILKEIGY